MEKVQAACAMELYVSVEVNLHSYFYWLQSQGRARARSSETGLGEHRKGTTDRTEIVRIAARNGEIRDEYGW